MAKQRTSVEVDEEYIKAVMAADIPQIRMRQQIAAEQKAARENLEPHQVQVTDEDMNTPEVNAEMKELLTAPSIEPKVSISAPTHAPKRKREGRDFESLFLVKRANATRKQSYMSQDTYEQISRYLRVIAHDMTVPAYVDNVLRHHIEQFREEINELYLKNFQKPI